MPWNVHYEFHYAIGTRKSSGGTLSGYVTNDTNASNRRPTISATVVEDEDLFTTNTSLAVSNSCCTYYLSGSNQTEVYVTNSADIVPLSGETPYYNSYTTSNTTWSQTLVTANNYVSVWCLAVPVTVDAGSQLYRYIWVQGQTAGTLVSQQALNPFNLTLGAQLIAMEGVFICQVILGYVGPGGGHWNINSVVNLSGTRQSQLGSAVSGYLASVNSDTNYFSGLGTPTSPLTKTSNIVSPLAAEVFAFFMG